MRFPQFIVAAVAWLAIICAAVSAHAEKRVALVVGNGAYRHAETLENPVNDARGLRDALKQMGFEVIYGENLDQRSLRQTIGQFARAVRGAGVAIVYFAGHGATFGDTPYVVPVDAEFSSLEQVPYELVPVELLIGELRHVNGVRIAILDACRDNAAERELKRLAAGVRGGGGAEMVRGLAPLKNPEGLILAYATQYLSTAADSAGAGNSPFTAALLHNIATPGLDVKELFFRVGQEVVLATDNRQRPEISISMYDSYALVPAPAKPVDEVPVVAPVAPAPAKPAELPVPVVEPVPVKPAEGRAPVAAPVPAKPVEPTPVRAPLPVKPADEPQRTATPGRPAGGSEAFVPAAVPKPDGGSQPMVVLAPGTPLAPGPGAKPGGGPQQAAIPAPTPVPPAGPPLAAPEKPEGRHTPHVSRPSERDHERERERERERHEHRRARWEREREAPAPQAREPAHAPAVINDCVHVAFPQCSGRGGR